MSCFVVKENSDEPMSLVISPPTKVEKGLEEAKFEDSCISCLC